MCCCFLKPSKPLFRSTSNHQLADVFSLASSVARLPKGSVRPLADFESVSVDQAQSITSESPPTVVEARRRTSIAPLEAERRKSLASSSQQDPSEIQDEIEQKEESRWQMNQEPPDAINAHRKPSLGSSQRQRTLTRQTASCREGSPCSADSKDSQEPQAGQEIEPNPKSSDQQQDDEGHTLGKDLQDRAAGSEEQFERRRGSRRKSRSSKADSSLEEQLASEADQPKTIETHQCKDSPEYESSSGEPMEDQRRKSKSQPPVNRRRLTRTPSRQVTEAAGEVVSIREPRHSRATSEHRLVERRAYSMSPSLAASVNIRQILENVAEVEGPFAEPGLAFRVAMSALEGPCWSTKVEGLLGLIRLASHQPESLLDHLHEVVTRVAQETQNLRSTVARSAIFTLGDFCAKLKRRIEPEMDIIVQSLLHKSMENTAFIRDDIRRAFHTMVDNLTHWRLANSLIVQGSSHKNVHVRRMASQFVALLVERMGTAKCLVGARDISARLIPAAARFAQDNSPHTRYYGRLILDKIMSHNAFERLARKYLTPNLYRSTIGIIESVRRRGAGDLPAEL